MRWIALHLPRLSLETFVAATPADGRPRVLVDAQKAAVVAADAAAQALGIEPGQKRATALALAPQALLGQADAARDLAAVTAVAHAALAFTPMVVLPPADDASQAPDTVLLEVQSTLRLHGGLDALLCRLREALAPLGHRVHGVDAPVPQAAALLARLHRRLHCADRAALRAALDAAPVWSVGPGRAHWEALEGMGLRTLADLRRLPRVGLARRFGEGLLAELDRAYGDRPDPRTPLALPPVFESRLELFARADTTEQVLHGAAVLLERLVAWLAARHALARRFTLTMQHEPRWRSDAATPAATPLAIALAEPSRDRVHLQLLLRERLAAVALPAPTIELRIACADVAERSAPSGELFPTPGSEREGLVRLVERLAARLGPEQVQRLEIVADHRPEKSTAVHAAIGPPAKSMSGSTPRSASKSAPLPPEALLAIRPVWLVVPPEPLGLAGQKPVLGGQVLQLVSGPERIETGWWDGELAERDYFIAQDRHGALVWVFRHRLPAGGPGWFLQGRFA
jgi:protein ImuB